MHLQPVRASLCSLSLQQLFRSRQASLRPWSSPQSSFSASQTPDSVLRASSQLARALMAHHPSKRHPKTSTRMCVKTCDKFLVWHKGTMGTSYAYLLHFIGDRLTIFQSWLFHYTHSHIYTHYSKAWIAWALPSCNRTTFFDVQHIFVPRSSLSKGIIRRPLNSNNSSSNSHSNDIATVAGVELTFLRLLRVLSIYRFLRLHDNTNTSTNSNSNDNSNDTNAEWRDDANDTRDNAWSKQHVSCTHTVTLTDHWVMRTRVSVCMYVYVCIYTYMHISAMHNHTQYTCTCICTVIQNMH